MGKGSSSAINVLWLLLVSGLFIFPISALDPTNTMSTQTSHKRCGEFHGIDFFVGERCCFAGDGRRSAPRPPVCDRATWSTCSHDHLFGSFAEEGNGNEANNSLFLQEIPNRQSVRSSGIWWWRCITNNYEPELNESCTTTKDSFALFLIPIIICIMVYDYRSRRRVTLPNRGGATNLNKLVPQNFFCKICMEHKPLDESFQTGNCSHNFCFECIRNHVTIKVQQQNSAVVQCMEVGCSTELKMESCRRILNNEVAERWSTLLIESSFLPSQKFYCPFNNCSALLWNDSPANTRNSIMQAECPLCHRLFCAQCRVGWHAGLSCAEFQNRQKWNGGKVDEYLMKGLASEKRWQRCPKCRFYVDKITGCLQITCRCGFQFCYRCGSKWSAKHYNCQTVRRVS